MAEIVYTDPNSVYVPSNGTAPTAAYLVQVNTDDRALRNRVGARRSTNSAQTFTGTSTTKVTLGTVDWDVGTYTGTANRLTVPTNWGGTYLVQASLTVSGTGSGAGSFIIVSVSKNATTTVYEDLDVSAAGGMNSSMADTFTLPLVATDFLEMFVSTNTVTGVTHHYEYGCHLAMVWLHP
jgi:hypothetical protein